MDSNTSQSAILFFGDVSDTWVDGTKHVFEQATKNPWLHSFLQDLFFALEEEVGNMEPFLQMSFGIRACSSFQELAQKHHHSVDQTGLIHAMLSYAARATLLLQ